MRTVPERSPWMLLTATFGLMVFGPLVGLALAVFLTPDSNVTQTLSPLAFGITFVGGLLAWMGVGIIAVVGRFLFQLLRGGIRSAEGPKHTERLVPPGYRIFPFLGGAMGFGMGLLAGLLTPLSVITGVGAWGVTGAFYRYVLRRAAHDGYLPFPEPE